MRFLFAGGDIGMRFRVNIGIDPKCGLWGLLVLFGKLDQIFKFGLGFDIEIADARIERLDDFFIRFADARIDDFFRIAAGLQEHGTIRRR